MTANQIIRAVRASGMLMHAHPGTLPCKCGKPAAPKWEPVPYCDLCVPGRAEAWHKRNAREAWINKLAKEQG